MHWSPVLHSPSDRKIHMWTALWQHRNPRPLARVHPFGRMPRQDRPSGGRGALILVGSLLFAASACDLSEASSSGAPDDRPWWEIEGVAPPTQVDSVFPIEEEIRRFREGLDEVTGFTSGAASMQELVDTMILALESEDPDLLASLAMTRQEFAWLYYPHTMYTSRPYELSPSLVWFQQQNRSSRGIVRLLDRYAGEELFYTGFDCPDEGEAFGNGWIHHGCTVLGELPTGEKVEERLFGSILEIDGVWKFVSYSNEL